MATSPSQLVIAWQTLICIVAVTLGVTKTLKVEPNILRLCDLVLALVGVAVEAVLAVRVVVAAPAQVAALGARAAGPHAAAVLGSQGQEVPQGANNKAGSQLQISAIN